MVTNSLQIKSSIDISSGNKQGLTSGFSRLLELYVLSRSYHTLLFPPTLAFVQPALHNHCQYQYCI